MIRNPVRVIRDNQTGKFLRKAGGWTDRVQEAARFLSIREIVRACEQVGLTTAEIVYQVNDSFNRPSSRC